MQKISQIMCVIDPTTNAQPAMQRAAWLAGKTGAELELFICYYNEYLSGERLFDSPSLEKARQEVIRGHEKHLDSLAELLRNAGLVVKTTAVWDHPLHEGIIRHAAASGADVVFKDTHHHSAIARALLTNTDWNLIRSCASPLWLVKSRDIPAHPIFVAAVDPMHEHDKPAALDDEILDLGKTLADATGAELQVFHSYDPRMAIASATANAYIPVSLPFQELEEQVIADHNKHFDRIIEKNDIDRGSSHLVAGLTHEELPEFCGKIDAAVVVMGAVSRNRWKRLFIGATAERTLEHLPCDLLIVKPNWFRVPVEIEEDRAA
jgi:universal stress protein E